MANALIFEHREMVKNTALADNSVVKDKVVGNYAALKRFCRV